MLTIIFNKDIEVSIKDTFSLTIYSEGEFIDGEVLKFEISRSEDEDPIISKEFSLSDNCFEIQLSEEEKKKLSLGSYIYRMILLHSSGEKTTEKSGNLTVKWGE